MLDSYQSLPNDNRKPNAGIVSRTTFLSFSSATPPSRFLTARTTKHALRRRPPFLNRSLHQSCNNTRPLSNAPEAPNAFIFKMAAMVANGQAHRRHNLHLVVCTSRRGRRCCEANLWPQSNEDSVYEQDILRDPSSIKPWLAYLDFKSRWGNVHEKSFVMARACAQLPRSYKLWKMVSFVAQINFANESECSSL